MKVDDEILALTGLRFVAAFYVFVFHIHIRWPVAENEFLKNILGQGAIGMSLFFVLSGFVLAHRYADGKTTLKAYLANRFARIYPVYLAAALVTLPWIGLSLGTGSPVDIAKAIGQGALLIVANIFLIQAWFPQFFDYWNNGGSWSISVEAFCYLLLPAFLPVLARLPMRRLMLVATLCYVLGVLPGISGVLFSGAPRGVFYSMPIFRLPEFLIGVCALLAFRSHGSTPFDARHQLAFTGALLLYLGFAGPLVKNYVGHNWIVLPFVTFMILSLAGGRGPIASLLASPVSVWLGKISYCFYSFQALVILALKSHHDNLVRLVPLLADSRWLLVAALAVLLGISAAGYYLIEEPARRKIRQVWGSGISG